MRGDLLGNLLENPGAANNARAGQAPIIGELSGEKASRPGGRIWDRRFSREFEELS